MVIKYNYCKIGAVPKKFEKYVAKWCILQDPGEKSTSFKNHGGGSATPCPSLRYTQLADTCTGPPRGFVDPGANLTYWPPTLIFKLPNPTHKLPCSP